MSANPEKKHNRLAGIIILVIVAAIVLIDILFFEKDLVSLYFLPIVCPLVCGLLLLFVRIRSYGWAIALSIFLSLFIKDLVEYNNDITRMVVLGIACVVSLGLLLYKNLNKK